MKDFRELKKQMLANPKVAAEYERLAPEFELVGALIDARSKAGMTQKDIAERMDTTQSVVARMEGGRQLPSLKTLQKFAEATKTRLKISFEPAEGKHV